MDNLISVLRQLADGARGAVVHGVIDKLEGELAGVVSRETSPAEAPAEAPAGAPAEAPAEASVPVSTTDLTSVLERMAGSLARLEESLAKPS